MSPIAAWKSLEPQQRRSGLAGWLGWLFDGLDMHLYTLVAMPFVASLLMVPDTDPEVKVKAAWIQAAFLVGWAVGGTLFGILGDRLGRSRALMLTILTYSLCCGLSALSTEWWHLMIFRFLSALGIGGEWAVGAALLSETLPRHWRPWIAAVLQTAVNLGILLACLAGSLMAGLPERYIFLVGLLPALVTLWIRKAVPEPAEWQEARKSAPSPSLGALFTGGQASRTWRALLLCAVALTAHWAFLFWQQSYVRSHPALALADKDAKNQAVAVVFAIIISASIVGNFLAGGLARKWGYGRAIAFMSLGYGASMAAAFSQTWSWGIMLVWFALIGLWQGLMGLFTMALPPLFPTLLRTTGAGFCFNIGRIAAAAGTIYFGIQASVSNTGTALFWSSLLFIPAAILAFLLPTPDQEEGLTTEDT